MSRTAQPLGRRGSLKWIQQAVNGSWPSLDAPILASIPQAKSIRWASPLKDDEYAEYRDEDFLKLLNRADLVPALSDFWPSRGPQWDALALTDTDDLILVEAKAHVSEMCSPGTAAKDTSRARIEGRLDELAVSLAATPRRAAWADVFYQLANRLAHLAFLRDQGVSAYLVLVNFLSDTEMHGPTSVETWEAAYDVAFHAMGLPKSHRLSRYLVHVYPEVTSYLRASEV
jgi:hypothetical protein